MLQIANYRLDREQLVALAQATPYAMLGYAINVLLACMAFWGNVSSLELGLWTAFSLVVCGTVVARARMKPRDRQSFSKGRDAGPAILFSILLALPWSFLATRWLGAVSGNDLVVLLALAVGMAASGSILLAPVPIAAIVYAATILVPVAVKFLVLGGRENVVLAGLAVSFLFFLIVLIAVTGRMFLERLDAVRKAKQAYDKAQRATDAKSEFFATMSHEIRTPLNSVIGYTSLVLARRNLRDEDARDLAVVRDAGRALLSVVNDILDFSALEAGRLKLVRGAVLLRPIVESCLALILVEARKKGLSLNCEIDRALDDLPIYADGQRIRQVLLNLIGNAVKFTAQGSVTVEVNCRKRSPQSVTVHFSVRDTGPGIPSASIPDLFKRFSQLDSSRERRFGGSGLGLAICKRIVEAKGGTIGVESQLGVGSMFWFEIAFALSKVKPADTPAVMEVVLPKAESKHILIVDDVEPNRRLTATVLKSVGHRVTTAASGQEAIARVSAADYDLVLMDVQMPGMSGLAATKNIKRLGGKRASIPIIGMTANIFPDDIANCYAAGMVGHLGKPFEFDELIRCVEAALDVDQAPESASSREQSFPEDSACVG
ncbi:ATP-binding protein [Hyphomicrobium sp.]|jgi:signal transduction histidine kinase/CheY-like chemotaxis protein|uniref:ATP-binding protein n=1 Tax=Hyphomicrobium sp. TaxID=82 RepID=UPI002C796269|nr:ATP-binding protein [Hyphomicrobium sp.]HVZ05637.1 ATP-binding protein [Hyphomicrobium sp.]